MTTPMYAVQGTSIVRRTAVVLAFAGVGFIAGSLVHNPMGSPDVRRRSRNRPRRRQSNMLQDNARHGHYRAGGR